jgi:hypothetical protein
MRTKFYTGLLFLFLMGTQFTSAQTWDLNGNTTTGQHIGTNNNQPFPIHAGGFEWMRIEPGGDIGIGMTNPVFRVDVDNGDINVNTAANGYRIDGEYVIWHNADVSNIYVGVGAGIVDGGNNNTFVGNDAGAANTTGTDNTFVGRDAGTDNNGDNNTFVGSGAGAANTTGAANVFIGTSAAAIHETGDQNVIIGADAAWNSDGDGNVIIGGNGTGSGNVGGSFNTFIGFTTLPGAANLTNASAIGANAQVDCDDCMVLGDDVNVGIGTTSPAFRVDVDGGDINIVNLADGYRIDGDYVLTCGNDASSIYVGIEAGIAITTGAANAFVGHQAGGATTTGGANTFLGNGAANLNETGSSNVAVGTLANGSGTTGDENVAVGVFAGFSTNGGNGNVSVGTSAGFDMTTGEFNVSIGQNAGDVNETGSNNVFIGHNARPSTNNFTNAGAIGANAFVGASNSIVIGSINGQNGWIGASAKVGIGTTTPSASLHIDGTFRYRVNGANPTNGYILTTDGSGNATWQAPPSGGGNVSACGSGNTTDMLTKWNPASSNTICNSIVYDNGQRVGISTNSPIAKFHILNTVTGIGTLSASSNSSSIFNIGTLGTAENSAFANVGVCGNAPSNNSFWGFPPVLTTISPLAIPYRAGVVGRAQSGNFNFGGIFEANAYTGCSNYNIGVYASAIKTCSTPAIAGFFRGEIYCSGQPNQISDAQFKDSITSVTNALDIIEDIQVKSYKFKTDSFPYMNFPDGRKYGLLAQQIDTVVPSVVSSMLIPQVIDTAGNVIEDTIRTKAVNYTGLIPLTIAAIQEQQAQIEGKVGTCSLAGSTPPNYLPKWDTLNRVLCNSQVYDDGLRVGIPTVLTGSYFNVDNTTDTVAATFSSTNTYTSSVVSARFNTDSGVSYTAAVRGYSRYQNALGDNDGIGGDFEGGLFGVKAVCAGTGAEKIGITGEAHGGSSMNVGVVGVSEDSTGAINAGTMGYAQGSTDINAGVAGLAELPSSTALNIGVVGVAIGSANENMAGNFIADDTIGINYAVHAKADGRGAPNSYAGYFDGDVHVTGSLTWTSDAALKNNIAPIPADSALALLSRLNPKTYEYDQKSYPYMALPQGKQYGLVAQEVEQVFPELVTDIIHPEVKNMKGQQLSPRMTYKGVNYVGLIPVLISSLKQQQEEIEQQKTQIDSLHNVITDRLTAFEARLNGCCGTGAAFKNEGEDEAAVNKINVELTSMQVIVLEQNVPNPFAEQTSISYYLPEDITGAQIVFTDILGNTIKTADVKSGYGVVTVFAANLSSGQYSYSLIVNGKVVETKRMVKQK